MGAAGTSGGTSDEEVNVAEPGQKDDEKRAKIRDAKKQGKSAGEAGASTGAEKQRGDEGKERGSRSTNRR